ncbi:MAG: hypothetical protein ACLGIF_11260, partial [Actinomycetes bacterium]
LRGFISAYPTPSRQWWSPILAGGALAAGVVAVGSSRPWYYLAGLGVGLAATWLLLVVLLVSVLFLVTRFGDRAYGLISGTTPSSPRSLVDLLAGLPEPTMDRSLVPWLHDTLTDLAGLPRGEVLRFGHLWAGRDFARLRAAWTPASEDPLQRMAEHSDERLVNRELMTTDLARQRPYRFPLQPCQLDDPAQLWLDLSAAGTGGAGLFPAAVLDALRAAGEPKKVADRFGTELTLHPLPPPWDLPVIVAVRLSMALPGLFSAVRMYRIVVPARVEDDFGRTVLDQGEPLPPPDSPAEVAEELWFSDGGITSNFPVHFFDSPLPRWPTVSLNLGRHPDNAPLQDVGLPRDYDATPIRQVPLTRSGLSLVRSIFTTARTWRDSMQSAMPGYRNRIAQVRSRPNEGGTNLFMPRPVIASMALRGALAGARLRTRFSDPAQWDRFRWMRLRVAMSNLERLRATTEARRGFYADAFSGSEWLCDLAQAFGDVPADASVPWYEPPPEFWPEAAELLEEFAEAYTPGKVNALTTDVPRPEPLLRQVAQE